MIPIKIHPRDIGPLGPLKFARTLRKFVTQKKGGSAAKHAQLQADAEQYCNIHSVPFIRIPDGLLSFIFADGVGNSLQRWAPGLYGWLFKIRKEVSDYLLGCPDLICFRKNGSWNYCACFEFKTGGSKPRQGQIKFAKRVNVIVIRDYPAFKIALDEWMDEEDE